jgi:hypothetical protein
MKSRLHDIKEIHERFSYGAVTPERFNRGSSL